MRKNMIRLVGVGIAALATTGAAGIVVSAQAEGVGQAAAVPAASAPPSAPETANQPVVEREAGIVMEGAGELAGSSFMVTLYQNSRYGNSVQVVLGDPDEGRIGYLEQTEPFVVDGVLNATVMVAGEPVTLHGTVIRTGQPQRTTESYSDAGQRIVTRGTHTELLTEVTLAIAGQAAGVGFAPAFAYDLAVRKVDLYGN